MNVTFDAAERGDLRQCISSTSTLNNLTPAPTPQRSRASSLERRKVSGVESMNTEKALSSMSASYTRQELDISWMGGVIITCFFVSGLIDSVAFNSWNCFVGMQTGNTVFAALGISGQPRASHRSQYFKSFVAIGAFCLGTLFFNFLHRWHTGLAKQSTSRRRDLFATSFFTQALFIIVSAALVQAGSVSNRPFRPGTFSSGSHFRTTDGHPNYVDLVPIALLSFQAAGQVCLSRVLSLIELPTIVLSTLYHDFVSDLYGTRQLYKDSSSFKDFCFDKFRRQGKRFMSICALFVGALVGGEMYKSAAGMGGALWMAAGLKLMVSISFMVWKRDEDKQTILPK